MELTPAIRCALRILLSLAEEPLKPAPFDELARVANASTGLVRRTVDALAEARLVQSISGGYRLGFSERAIHLSDVFAALAARPGPATCALATVSCNAGAPCPMCWVLIEADIAAMESLRTHTLASLRREMAARLTGHASCS